jgi:hypothetical protein
MRAGLAFVAVLAVTACERAPAATRRYCYWVSDKDDAAMGGPHYDRLFFLRVPIERLEAALADEPGPGPEVRDSVAIYVTTYARDSLWNSDGDWFQHVRSVTRVQPELHMFVWDGSPQQYELAETSRVIHLLEHPEGTIDIARTGAPRLDDAMVQQLLRDLRAFPDQALP